MASVHLELTRDRAIAERIALRRGLSVLPAPVRPLVVAPRRSAQNPHCCTTCADSLESGALIRGGLPYCSLECSLGGRPA